MKIGELAGVTGVSASRIRYYETAGLLAPDRRTDAGYRVYGETAPQALRIIEQAQLAGFTLAEIKALLPEGGAGAWNRTAVLSALHRRLAALEEMERHLARSRRKLQAAIRDVEGKPADVSCAENADRIIDRLGSLPG